MRNTPKTDPHRARAWRRAAHHAVLATALLTASTVEAWTLDALLRLPLERLMELRVAVQHATAQRTTVIASRADPVETQGVGRAA